MMSAIEEDCATPSIGRDLLRTFETEAVPVVYV